MSSMHNVRTYFGLFELLVVWCIFCKILQPFCKLFSLFLHLFISSFLVIALLGVPSTPPLYPRINVRDEIGYS